MGPGPRATPTSGSSARASATRRVPPGTTGQAIECFRPFRDSALLPTALASQASVLALRDPARALKVVAAARAIKTRDGGDFPPVFRARADRAQAVAEAALGQQAAAFWKEGSRLDREEAIALAFGTPASRPVPSAG